VSREYDFDAEAERLRAIAVQMTAALGSCRGRGRPRSESRIAALVALDCARIGAELADGTLKIEGRTIVWEPR
jgi:hypothetical protein